MIRNRKYLDWVRERPCIVTGSSPCDPAHIRFGGGGGMGLKPDDNRVLPLVHQLHQEQHQIGEVRFWLEQANEHPEFLMESLLKAAQLDYRRWLDDNQ
tara:strand:+ start:4005 stop:4298 length:294 start_codon:yes stop_codon:yes gene_type:complete